MGIDVGEYIRTKNGIIFQVDKERKNLIMNEFMNLQGNRDILKHSKNIIDLIEVGDYVNGYLVLAVMEDLQNGELHLEMPIDYTNSELGDCTIYNKEIKSIVTKEQFQSIEYRLEDK